MDEDEVGLDGAGAEDVEARRDQDVEEGRQQDAGLAQERMPSLTR